jgi:hypothetical protein
MVAGAVDSIDQELAYLPGPLKIQLGQQNGPFYRMAQTISA